MAKATAGGKKKVFRKKEKKNIPVGIVYIAASFNNTMISITDLEGNLIAQSSSGARGFRGSRKGTPFAAQQAAFEAAKRAMEAGMQQCEVRVKGPGGGRESAIRAINNAGIRVSAIREATWIIVLDEGRIAGIGTHQELMASSPVYREIVSSQIGVEVAA